MKENVRGPGILWLCGTYWIMWVFIPLVTVEFGAPEWDRFDHFKINQPLEFHVSGWEFFTVTPHNISKTVMQ